MGVLGMTYFYGWEVIHVALMSSVSWLLMNFLPRDKQQKYVCAYVFAYLSFSQIHRVLYYFGSYKLDITLNTMLLTCRLQALAFSYYDGGQPRDKLTARQHSLKVDQLPTVFEMASFTFFVQ